MSVGGSAEIRQTRKCFADHPERKNADSTPMLVEMKAETGKPGPAG
jgi:hypothetical protein